MNYILENYLKENIDTNIRLIPWDGKDKLPLYLLELYRFYKVKLLDEDCIFIEILNEASGIDVLKKHIKMIRNEVKSQVVLVYQSITYYRRKTLIENRIPFLVENGQMYLPFLGLELKKIAEKREEKADTFSFSAQLTFLYLLYNPKIVINASELAKFLKMSNMTASRALNDLYHTRLLVYEIGGKTGRSKNYFRIKDPIYYYEGRRYLKNPVWKTVFVQEKVDGMLFAGLEALSLLSMINLPPNPVRAISKERFSSLQSYVITDKDRIADEKLTELEIWHYDPMMISQEKHVDKASLSLSLKDVHDERVEQAIDEMLKGEKWYTG